MIKVAIAGFGFSARTFHIPFLQTLDDYHLTAVVSSRPDEVHAFNPALSVYASLEQALDGQSLDLVVITTPNQLHFEQAQTCLQRGVNVVLEKPMVVRLSEARQLMRLAQEHKLLLSVFHNRRWDGDFLTLRQLIAQGSLGDIRVFESHFDRFRPQVRQRWRESTDPGAGLWYDLGSHLADQALLLFGRPLAVTGRCLRQREGAAVAIDYFHVMLHYAQTEVILHATCLAAAPNLRFQLQGTRGSYVKYGLDPQEEQLKLGMTHTVAGFGAEAPEQWGRCYSADGFSEYPTLDGCYQNYYRQLAAAINGTAGSPVAAAEAVQVMEVLDIARRSASLGKTLELD